MPHKGRRRPHDRRRAARARIARRDAAERGDRDIDALRTEAGLRHVVADGAVARTAGRRAAARKAAGAGSTGAARRRCTRAAGGRRTGAARRREKGCRLRPAAAEQTVEQATQRVAFRRVGRQHGDNAAAKRRGTSHARNHVHSPIRLSSSIEGVVMESPSIVILWLSKSVKQRTPRLRHLVKNACCNDCNVWRSHAACTACSGVYDASICTQPLQVNAWKIDQRGVLLMVGYKSSAGRKNI